MSKDLMTQRPKTIGAMAEYVKGNNQDFSGGLDEYPVLSPGKTGWRLKRDGEMTALMRDGNPVTRLTTIILSANPHMSRAYFSGFQPGQTDAPLCTSIEGIRPDSGSPVKQSQFCESCKQNEWGSAINESTGVKTKACGAHKRICLLLPGVQDPVLLRVPFMSTKALTAYGRELQEKHDAHYRLIKTLIRYDLTADYQLLVFEPISWLNEKEQELVARLMKGGRPDEISGVTEAAKKMATMGGYSGSGVDATYPESPAPVEQPGTELDPDEFTVELDAKGTTEAAPPPAKPAQATRKKRAPAKKKAAAETTKAAEAATVGEVTLDEDTEAAINDILGEVGLDVEGSPETVSDVAGETLDTADETADDDESAPPVEEENVDIAKAMQDFSSSLDFNS